MAPNYTQAHQGTAPDKNLFTPEYLATLNSRNLPPHELILTVKSIVMLTKNLNFNQDLCNGTIVQDF